jgi:fibronectin type 3 domain-containing protein
MEANNSRETTTAEKPTISGMPTTTGTASNVGSTNSRRDLNSSMGRQQQQRWESRDETTAVCMNTSTAGLTEGPTTAQETTGSAGDANSGRDTKTDGHIGIRREINKSREATAGTLGRLTAERTTKRKG